VSKRGVSPSSIKYYPPLLFKERGIKGVRLKSNLKMAFEFTIPMDYT
jgi:hypothetical protein